MFGTYHNPDDTALKKKIDIIFSDFVKRYPDQHKISTIIQFKKSILRSALSNLDFKANKLFFTKAEEQQLSAELDKIIYFCDSSVPLFQNAALETVPAACDDATEIKISSNNLIKYLLAGTPFGIELIRLNLLKAIRIERNPAYLQGIRTVIQDIFLNIATYVSEHTLTQEQEKNLDIQIADILAMYTFFDPFVDDQKIIQIPQKLKCKWQLIDFTIHAIKLAFDSETKHLFQDSNKNARDALYPAYSYVLMPTQDKLTAGICPRLLFMGTPPPAGQGHFYAALTDCTPQKSIGETMYYANREKIYNKLQTLGLVTAQDEVNYPLIVSGQSLGGILSLFFVLDRPQLCNSVHALNPPGFYPETLKKPFSWDNIPSQDKANKVFIHYQKGDPVKHLGYWKEEWNIIKVYKPNPTLSVLNSIPNPFSILILAAVNLTSRWLAHLQSFSNMPHTIAIHQKTSCENNKTSRKILTNLKKSADPLFFNIISKNVKKRNHHIVNTTNKHVSSNSFGTKN